MYIPDAEQRVDAMMKGVDQGSFREGDDLLGDDSDSMQELLFFGMSPKLHVYCEVEVGHFVRCKMSKALFLARMQHVTRFTCATAIWAFTLEVVEHTHCLYSHYRSGLRECMA